MTSNSEIKEQLLFVSNKIDEAIRQYRQSKAQEIQMKRQEELMNENSPNYIGRINALKTQIESLQKNLDEVYNINKITQLESDIKKNEKELKELKAERYILNNAVKEQNKGINEYLSKFDSTKEIKELTDQIKIAKEENHERKEVYKEVTNTLKTQKNKIDALEKRCKIIKQNIEFQKKKQMKEVQKDEKSDGEEDEYGGDLEKMDEAEKNLINQINAEEKNFRIEINEQNDRIKQLKVDINRIDFKIKNLKQEKKLDEIKKKNKIRGKSTTKHQQNNSNNAKNNQIRDNKRHLSNYKQKKNSPNNININNLKSNKTSNTDKRTMLRTPNIIVKDTERYTKPFEIKKFNDFSNNTRGDTINDEKNYTMFNENKKLKLTTFNDNKDNKSINYDKNRKNKGITALKEIENLKHEIQKALKNNIVAINDDDIKSNYTKDNMNDFHANRTGGFSNQSNNFEKDKDEDAINDKRSNKCSEKTVCLQIERNIKDYQLNVSEKGNEETNKRKPFDKFNFK